MSGLEKIISQIMADAKVQADEITAQAEKEAAQILDEASREAQKLTEDADVKTKRAVENVKSRGESAIDMHRRTAVLQAKQEVIGEMYEKAYQAVCNENEQDYFNRMEHMIEQYAQPMEGTIIFSKKDLDRLPQDFRDRINAAAAKANGSLQLSGEGADIENGFILSYGGVEENCTLRAMFETKKDELYDIIQKVLYE
jgi:V/A-type H+-transporting ATPase subunit E